MGFSDTDTDTDTSSLVESQFSQESAFVGGASLTDAPLDLVEDSLELIASKGFTIVSAANGFNELNQMVMLWTVHHLWHPICIQLLLAQSNAHHAQFWMLTANFMELQVRCTG